jgi:hypothetical protein
MDAKDTANGEGGSLTPTQQYDAAGTEVLAAFEGASGVSCPHGSDPFAMSPGFPRSAAPADQFNMSPHMTAVLQSLQNLLPEFDDLEGGGFAGRDESELIDSIRASHYLFEDEMDARIRTLSGVECKSISMNEQGCLSICGAPIFEGGTNSRSARLAICDNCRAGPTTRGAESKVSERAASLVIGQSGFLLWWLDESGARRSRP